MRNRYIKKTPEHPVSPAKAKLMQRATRSPRAADILGETMISQVLEAAMLLCFGLSWPTNAYKNYKARTAAGTSWQFIMLITLGYFAGIGAKFVSGELNWVLAIYFLNLVFLAGNWAVYFRNRALDKARIAEAAATKATERNVEAGDMLKTLVFATDGSDESLNAIEYAAHSLDMAKAKKVEVLSVAAAETEASRTAANNAAVQATAKMKELGIAAEAKTRNGEPAAEIIDEASKADAELIVMGSRGLSGLKQILLGSVSRKVSENASCPVLIVR